jgi:SAM-dependent methyltransferase
VERGTIRGGLDGFADVARTRHNELAEIDREIRNDPNSSLSDHFSGWPIEDFGALYLADLSEFPALAAELPAMPSADVQRRYTWWEGAELMVQSVEFVRTLSVAYPRWSGAGIEDATVLDYGAGWGRLSRMLLQFIPGDRVYACDAWKPTVDIYNSLGFKRPCDLVAPVPTNLPYNRGQFDLVWLFSVLTHLPAEAADAVMRALHGVVAPSGLVVLTIRSPSFWRANPLVAADIDVDAIVEQHRSSGFAHVPDATAPNWGDTSMSPEYITERWPEWRVVATEDNWTHQVKVFVRPSP